LKKSLYGLKQSPRAWVGKFSKVVESFGLSQSKSDHSVFYKNSEGTLILLVVYVDDIVITGDDEKGISSLKELIHTQFYTKDLDELRYFKGVEVLRNNGKIFLLQGKCVLDLLTETRKLGAKPCNTPMIANSCFTKDCELFEDPEKYRRLVGKLNYLNMTRTDIAHSVSVINQFMCSPIIHH